MATTHHETRRPIAEVEVPTGHSKTVLAHGSVEQVTIIKDGHERLNGHDISI